jgi:hypothetical protein
MSKITFDKSKASRIAQAVADCADKGGQVRTMRERLVAEFKGLPRKPLDETQEAMVKDALTANITARTTVAPKSVGPMVSTATKIAKWMPCMLGMEVVSFTTVADSYGSLAKFATAVKDAEGDCAAALKARKSDGRKDYKKSAAAHLKALVGLKDGKFFTPAQKALVVALADSAKIDLGEKGTDARNAKLAASAL